VVLDSIIIHVVYQVNHICCKPLAN